MRRMIERLIDDVMRKGEYGNTKIGRGNLA